MRVETDLRLPSEAPRAAAGVLDFLQEEVNSLSGSLKILGLDFGLDCMASFPTCPLIVFLALGLNLFLEAQLVCL